MSNRFLPLLLALLAPPCGVWAFILAAAVGESFPFFHSWVCFTLLTLTFFAGPYFLALGWTLRLMATERAYLLGKFDEWQAEALPPTLEPANP